MKLLMEGALNQSDGQKFLTQEGTIVMLGKALT